MDLTDLKVFLVLLFSYSFNKRLLFKESCLSQKLFLIFSSKIDNIVQYNPGSGSKFGTKFWIRIRFRIQIQSIRIHNTGLTPSTTDKFPALLNNKSGVISMAIIYNVDLS